jgi:phosphoglycerate dehydrogenase-like enzyme
VVVTNDADAEERAAILTELDGVADVRFLHDAGDDDRRATLADAVVLLGWNMTADLTPQELEPLTSVRLIQLLSAGADGIDFGVLPRGATVAANVGAYALPMAEFIAGMALALAKRLRENHDELAHGRYPRDPETAELRGGVASVIGFGGIGRACADLFRAMGMRIHAVNTSGKTDEDVEFVGTLADLEPVLRAADVAVIAIPLTVETRGLIGARELSWMKPTAILINVARAAIVDEAALYEHLAATPTFSAGIDVWWDEPPRGGEFRPKFPFLELPNVLGSPHNSGIVPGMAKRAAMTAARNVAVYLRGDPPSGIQRPEDYSPSARIE